MEIMAKIPGTIMIAGTTMATEPELQKLVLQQQNHSGKTGRSSFNFEKEKNEEYFKIFCDWG